jgi:hypothetical protein
VLGASAHHRAVAGNRVPRGARDLGRGGIRAGEGDRAIAAEGWQAAAVASLPDDELTDWLVRTRQPASQGAWRASGGQACGVERSGVRRGHGIAGRGGNAGHALGT